MLVAWAKSFPDYGLAIFDIDLDPGQLVIVSYADASWGSAPGGKSQGGYLVTATLRACLAGKAPASVLDWRSGRVKRVVRSTLAAEACMADAGIDAGRFIALCLVELLGRSPATSDLLQIDHGHATDCRSLYDAVLQNSASMEEKRTLLTVKATRGALYFRNLRWVPTDAMHADGRT